MSNGTGPPPPLGSHPNGIDLTDPKYEFNTEDWIETPRQFPETFINGTTMTLRKENDSAYQKVGNASTWEKYITLGYHAYDHCFQFETQSERMKENEMDALTFIWNVYSYHLNRALDMPPKLERWAIDIARPFLLNNMPSALSPDTSDPRNARLNYEEPDFMELFDSEMDSKRPAIEDWKLVGGKQKMRPNKDATQTPLPTSPERQKQQQPAKPTTENPTEESVADAHSTNDEDTDTTTENAFVRINDGTLRITVKWKPTKYDEVLEDTNLWNYEATDLVHYILGTATGAVIYPWKTAPGAAPAILFIDLTPDNLPEYLGLRTIPISSSKMFIFSFRLCLTAGPREWLKNPVKHDKIWITTTWISASQTHRVTAAQSRQLDLSSTNIRHSPINYSTSKNSAVNFPCHPIFRPIAHQENTNRKSSSPSGSQMRRKSRRGSH
ncbi:hypothetical protein MHU86_9348 [Fragilaria crotonensis]|nr:hypothetical protein MHU86_9348 [Fragilaria crotonensis]